MRIVIEIDCEGEAMQSPSEVEHTMRRLVRVFGDHEWVQQLIDRWGEHTVAVTDRFGNTIGRMNINERVR